MNRAAAETRSLELLERRDLLSTVTVQLGASQDTTIYDVLVGDRSNGSGQYLVTGGGLDSAGVKRALVQFDLGAAGIPTGSTIVDAVLTMHLSQSVGGSGIGVDSPNVQFVGRSGIRRVGQ